MSHVPTDTLELAELYAAGELAPSDADAFEDRLREGDEHAVAAFRQVQAASDAFIQDVEELRPSAALRDRLAQSLQESGELEPPSFAKQADTNPLLSDLTKNVILKADDAEWTPLGVPGVVSRPLFNDLNSVEKQQQKKQKKQQR
eukprot:TRINITY_DN38622_c1_g1_i3.p3 TRINITY_DN38622_c1_g1~~TRINITY_DN38622_c1_g1_i3.p3  ORF type:complete len:145 (-),score=23.90 TRINITY_DN38622_c1_g1_i3:32-466(-)